MIADAALVGETALEAPLVEIVEEQPADAARLIAMLEEEISIAPFFVTLVHIVTEWRARLPAVTHVDGSGRLQTVRREANPLYYDLIKEFGKLSGVPMLVNTSFNIRGEPIVCTPEDAYRCMMGTGIDCLFLEDALIFRDDNPGDKWDADAVAGD